MLFLTWKRPFTVIGLLFVIAILGIAFILMKNSPEAEYQVLRVIDGDTIVVEKLGKVRYIGVNTPETHHPFKGMEYYGKEAFAANQKLVANRVVRLKYDVQAKDKYGRTLAYVYQGDLFVNAELVKQGYAQVMTIPPNVKYADVFFKLQREARAAGKGLWGPAAPQSVVP
jgi:micrococcal nuclease